MCRVGTTLLIHYNTLKKFFPDQIKLKQILINDKKKIFKNVQRLKCDYEVMSSD